MGLLDASYSAVNTKKPRKSDRILPATELNARGLLDAATNVPIAGDALSGVLAAYDAAKGDYGSAAVNALGVLPFVSAGMVKGTGKIADAISPKKMTEYEKRHEIARQNAVKMLGLPENNTAMDRARAMGAVDAYHGTGADVQQIDVSLADSRRKTGTPSGAFVVTSNPKTANSYANENTGIGHAGFETYGDGGNVMPLMILKGKNMSMNANGDPWANLYNKKFPEVETTNDFAAIAKEKGKDSATIKNVKDNATYLNEPRYGDTTFVFNPALVRSRFAAFDPARINEPDMMGYADPRLLGLIGGGGLLGLGAYKANQE